MHLHSYRLRNYRRLKDAHIELAEEISIFVGSNNSGKTSATQAIHAFISGGKDRFNLYDFSSSCWSVFDEAGNTDLDAQIPDGFSLPSIDIDLWFEVSAPDLYLVIPLLPSTAWQGTKVGIRVSLASRNPINLIRNYQEAKARGTREVALRVTRKVTHTTLGMEGLRPGETPKNKKPSNAGLFAASRIW